jgi:N-acetylglutamate synthase/N-acetylornithine aminotransferase
MMAIEDEAMTLDTETIRHDEKQVGMVGPSKGNNLATMMACITTATRISIALPAATMKRARLPSP